MTLRALFAVLTVIFAFAAAICWFMAAFDKVSSEEAEQRRSAEAEENDDWIGGSMGIGGADLADTLALQAKWNRGGAIAAGCAALCQAAYTYLAEFS